MITFYTITRHYNAGYGRYPITVILTNSDPKKFLLFQTQVEPPLCLPTWPQVSLMILFTCELLPIFTKLRGFSSISPKRPKGKAKRRSCRRNPWLDKILMDGTEDDYGLWDFGGKNNIVRHPGELLANFWARANGWIGMHPQKPFNAQENLWTPYA